MTALLVVSAVVVGVVAGWLLGRVERRHLRVNLGVTEMERDFAVDLLWKRHGLDGEDQ